MGDNQCGWRKLKNATMRETINAIEDIVILDVLLKKIIKIESLEDFKLLLEKAKNIN